MALTFIGRRTYRDFGRRSYNHLDRLSERHIGPRLFGNAGNSTDRPPTVISMYDAPLAASIKSLKRVSFTTALLSLAIPPSVIFMGPEHIPIAGQAAVRVSM